MKNTIKRLLSLFLVLTMTVGIAPLTGFVGLKFPEIKLPEWNLFDFGVEAEAESFEWFLNEDGTILTISNIDGFYDQLDGYYESYSVFGEWYGYFGFLGALQQTILSAGMPTGVKEIELSEGATHFSVIDGALYVTVNDKDLLFLYPENKKEKDIAFSAEDIFTPYSFINCRNLKVSISDDFTENSIVGYQEMLDVYVEYGLLSESEAASITDKMIIESILGSVFATNTAESFKVSDTNKYLSSENGVLYNKDKSSVVKFPIDSDINEISVDSFPESNDFVGLVVYPAFCSFVGDTIDFYYGDILTGNTVVYNEGLSVHIAETGLEQLIDLYQPIVDSGYYVDVMYMYILVMGEKVCSDGNTSVLEEYNNIINHFKTLPNDRFAKNINNAEKCEGHHEYVSEVTKEPTCVDKGEKTYTCIHCDKTYIETIPASEDRHEYTVSEEILSTCLKQGYVTYKCSYCNDTYKETKPLNDHTAGEWEIVTDATTETEGEKVKKCTVCGTVLDTAVIPTISVLTGYCGENVTWELNLETGVLTISGEGEMDNYTSGHQTPWYNCRDHIKTVIINDEVTSVGDNSFNGYDDFINLEKLYIGNDVVRIGISAFSNCENLNYIEVGKKVKEIHMDAFWGCEKKTTVYFLGDISDWCNIKYLYTDNDDSSSFPWSLSRYTEKIYIDGEMITDLIIPENVTNINSFAFSGYRNLKSVYIPDTVTNVGNGAFAGCVNLTDISLCASITDIPDFFLQECISLESIVIPDGITSIGYQSFYDCDKLSTLYFPRSLKNIGYASFKFCKNIKDIYYNGTEEQWNESNLVSASSNFKDATIHFLDSPCVHQYTSEIIVNPTCTTDGERLYTCSLCGDTYIEKLDKTGHVAKEMGFDATCTVNGIIYSVCANCGITLGSTNVIPAKGHTPGEWETALEPTYETEGKKIRKCTVCGETVVEEIIEKLLRVTDEKTGVGFEYSGEKYDGEVGIIVEETFDGAAFNLIDTDLEPSQNRVFDIKITVDGVESQPNGEITVRMPIPEGYNPEKTFVYHINTVTGIVEHMPTEVVDNYLVFKTTHFSYYAVVELAESVDGVSIDDIALNYKTTVTLEDFIEITADKALDYEITYSSSDTSVATVDKDGNVTATGTGEAEITVTVTDEYGNVVEDTCTVTVSYAWWQWLIIIFLFGWIWY